ncbi:pro-resilin-like isoform X1 [Onthophagus taurus]|uniref:pro-resilin-like isoform X1 n=1 Tax=Onthophagus taurus TaxID=166361 RepID=UPI0039BDA5B8
MKIIIVLASLVAAVFAEPPVPSSRYLPSTRYLPSVQTNSFTSPSTQYGVPSSVFSGRTSGYAKQMNYNSISNAYLPASYSRSENSYEDDHSEPANYNFQYDVQDNQHGNDYGHEETRHEDNAQGKYSVVLPDGRKQTVEYTADSDGFKPKISYEQVSNGYNRNSNGYSNGGYSNGNAYNNNNGNSYNSNQHNAQVYNNQESYTNEEGGYRY